MTLPCMDRCSPPGGGETPQKNALGRVATPLMSLVLPCRLEQIEQDMLGTLGTPDVLG